MIIVVPSASLTFAASAPLVYVNSIRAWLRPRFLRAGGIAQPVALKGAV